MKKETSSLVAEGATKLNATSTPGPWRIADSSEIWANDQPVCTIADEENSNLDAETANANARLIAAAPCLLEALRFAEQSLSATECTGVKQLNTGQALEACRAAINKALGTP